MKKCYIFVREKRL